MRVRILLIEDNVVLATATEKILMAHNGLEFVAVPRADWGILKLQGGEKFDLVLMDLRLPGMSGIEAIKTIRQFNTSIPILVLSAFGDKSTRDKAREAGASGFVVKPPDYTDLYGKILDLVIKSRLSDDIDNRGRILTLQRRLNHLKNRQAFTGIDTSPQVLMEIEDLEAEISTLQENS